MSSPSNPFDRETFIQAMIESADAAMAEARLEYGKMYDVKEKDAELAYLEPRPEFLAGQKLYKERAELLSRARGVIYHRPCSAIRVLTSIQVGGEFLPVLQFNYAS